MSYQTLPTRDDDLVIPAGPGESNDSLTHSLLTGTASQGAERTISSSRRAFWIRCLALLCACSLSVGSHFASYTLGPLKSRLSRELGTSNTEFSLLISAFSLNSTWTPLLGGVLASRLGTTLSSILATSIVLLGQILLLFGDIFKSVRLMTLGMFIFGLGLSPLSVVQETIIVRFFKSHGLGLSLALGLVAGKGASFAAARISYPLSQRFGTHAPFYASTGLAALSVVVNLIYMAASRWFVDGTGAELEASDIHEEAQKRSSHSVSEAEALREVAIKHHVHFKEITHLGDVFWAYIGLNILCGFVWSPFIHLASNLIELRYHLTELNASNQASYLLAGSLIFYPICGLLVDRFRNRMTVIYLLILSSFCTLLCYAWLALPANLTHTALPGIFSFAFGHGFSPLLLVVIVPQLVPLRFVATALGAHKSLEQAGSATFQTLAGWLLDIQSKSAASAQVLLNHFLLLNVLHLFSLLGLFCLYRKQVEATERSQHSLLHTQEVTSLSLFAKVEALEEGSAEELPLMSSTSRLLDNDDDGDVSVEAHRHRRPRANSRVNLSPADPHHPRYLFLPDLSSSTSRSTGLPSSSSERRMIRRGEIFAALCCLFIVMTWLFFFVTVWLRLRSEKDRGGSTQ